MLSCEFVDRRLGHNNNTIHEITLNATNSLLEMGALLKTLPTRTWRRMYGYEYSAG